MVIGWFLLGVAVGLGTLFIEKNIVTLPGKYLAVSKNGKNPAENYVRIALVHNKKIVKESLEKISEIL